MKIRLWPLLLVSLLMLTGASAAAVWWTLFRPGPARDLNLVVPQGAPVSEVLDDLHAAGFLPSINAGKIYLRFFTPAPNFKFGTYHIPGEASPVEIFEMLLAGTVETFDVTIVEGMTAEEVCQVMSLAGSGSLDEWRALVAQSDLILDLMPRAQNLEGYLFPDTYRFAVGISSDRAARHLVDRFKEVWSEERSRIGSLWTAPEDIVVLASLIEAETSISGERSRIAGVFKNRLDRGMLLQCDPTVVYALKKRGEWQGRLLRIHWKVDDPYNTYLYPGLPPGPINNPGRESLAAAMNPDHHNELYFVAKPGGGHTFSRTLKEHNRAVWKLRRSRR